MTSPTTKEQRMEIWDALRSRFHLAKDARITSKKELTQLIRKTGNLRKGEKATGKTKSLLGYVGKSDFWQKSKHEDRFYVTQSKRSWQTGEDDIIRGLVRQGYKGKPLVSEFNARVTPNRSYMAVMVRKSNILGRRRK